MQTLFLSLEDREAVYERPPTQITHIKEYIKEKKMYQIIKEALHNIVEKNNKIMW